MSKISVIIPVYNAEDYLEELFESIIRQVFDDYTLIVVNDCSTDGSNNIINRYKSVFGEKLISLNTSVNSNTYGARNLGLSYAESLNSDYIIFLDSDDTIEETFLLNLYSKITKENADLAICGMRRFEDKTNRTICFEMISFPNEPVIDLRLFDDFAFINTSVCNKLFKSCKIRGIRFREVLRSEDTLFFMEVLPLLSKVVFTNTVEYNYRVRANSQTTGISQHILEGMYPAFEDFYKKYDNDRYMPFKDIFEAQTYVRIILGGVLRVALANPKSSKVNIKTAITFMDDVMPSWRKNKYLCFEKANWNNGKHFMVKLSCFMVKSGMFKVVIDLYNLCARVFKMEIRI